MATTFKFLAQDEVTSSSKKTVYTVPSSTKVVITSIQGVVYQVSGDVEFRIYHVKSGDSDSYKNIIKLMLVSAPTTYESNRNVVMETGDSIVIEKSGSGTINTCNINIYGVEIT
jgi:hypothetical protein